MAKKNIVRFQVIIVVFYLILSTASSLKLVNKMTTICSVKKKSHKGSFIVKKCRGKRLA